MVTWLGVLAGREATSKLASLQMPMLRSVWESPWSYSVSAKENATTPSSLHTILTEWLPRAVREACLPVSRSIQEYVSREWKSRWQRVTKLETDAQSNVFGIRQQRHHSMRQLTYGLQISPEESKILTVSPSVD